MPIQETFDYPADEFCKTRFNYQKLKDGRAMIWLTELGDCASNCKYAGVTYGHGSWGHTVLRTAYSDELDQLWPTAIDKLKRWVTQYFVHMNRLVSGKPDPSSNEELGRRFILETLDDEGTVSKLKKLNLPSDLAEASQEDIKALNHIFDNWVQSSIGDRGFYPTRTPDDDGEPSGFFRNGNPRFCDFLVIDEPALRSLAALPDETPPLHLVPREERRARDFLYGDAYLWLVDSQAVQLFDGVKHAPAVDYDWATGTLCYRGWLKLCASDIPDVWFERLETSGMDSGWQFKLCKMPEGPGDWWYRQA